MGAKVTKRGSYDPEQFERRRHKFFRSTRTYSVVSLPKSVIYDDFEQEKPVVPQHNGDSSKFKELSIRYDEENEIQEPRDNKTQSKDREDAISKTSGTDAEWKKVWEDEFWSRTTAAENITKSDEQIEIVGEQENYYQQIEVVEEKENHLLDDVTISAHNIYNNLKNIENQLVPICNEYLNIASQTTKKDEQIEVIETTNSVFTPENTSEESTPNYKRELSKTTSNSKSMDSSSYYEFAESTIEDDDVEEVFYDAQEDENFTEIKNEFLDAKGNFGQFQNNVENSTQATLESSNKLKEENDLRLSLPLNADLQDVSKLVKYEEFEQDRLSDLSIASDDSWADMQNHLENGIGQTVEVTIHPIKESENEQNKNNLLLINVDENTVVDENINEKVLRNGGEVNKCPNGSLEIEEHLNTIETPINNNIAEYSEIQDVDFLQNKTKMSDDKSNDNTLTDILHEESYPKIFVENEIEQYAEVINSTVENVDVKNNGTISNNFVELENDILEESVPKRDDITTDIGYLIEYPDDETQFMEENIVEIQSNSIHSTYSTSSEEYSEQSNQYLVDECTQKSPYSTNYSDTDDSDSSLEDGDVDESSNMSNNIFDNLKIPTLQVIDEGEEESLDELSEQENRTSTNVSENKFMELNDDDPHSQILNIIQQIEVTRNQMCGLTSNNVEDESVSQVYQSLMGLMKAINKVKNPSSLQEIYVLQYEALNKIHECLQEFNSKVSV